MTLDHIKGIAWDHRRCWGPLDADVPKAEQNFGLNVRWERRTLFSFGEGDLSPFIQSNDLIIYDHPFAGDVASSGLMLDLREFLSAEDIAVLEANQVGQSFRSYHAGHGIYGLPLDAAATTAAWRADLLEELGLTAPTTFDDVLKLGADARKHDKWIAWAAKPTDLLCAYVAMAASCGYNPGREEGPFVDYALSEEILGKIRDLRRIIHPKSFTWNPIQLYDHMTSNDDILYTPYAFNYVNYACLDERRLTFGAPPQIAHAMRPRGLLGGAGIGVSSRSSNPQAAFDYAMRLVAPQFQASDYVANGGQPGMRSAWVSSRCDRATNGFFSSCLQAMDDAYLRPNLPGFVGFFHEATKRLSALIGEETSHQAYWNWQTDSYQALREGAKAVAE